MAATGARGQSRGGDGGANSQTMDKILWRLETIGRVGDWRQVWSMEIVFIEGGVRLIDVGFYQRIEEGDNELGKTANGKAEIR